MQHDLDYRMLDTGQNSCTVSEVRMVTFGKVGEASVCKVCGEGFGGIAYVFLLCGRVGCMTQCLWEIHHVYIKKIKKPERTGGHDLEIAQRDSSFQKVCFQGKRGGEWARGIFFASIWLWNSDVFVRWWK